ncbi:hypothetical protein [Streptomyces cucumeris]|uniref:hypothetical protein n=1 Tax=Streptomyces cucumeris TaxID=2962890 RepID=UPI003D763F9F
MSYKQQMEERARQRDAAREAKKQNQPEAGTEAKPDVPAPGGEVNPLTTEPRVPAGGAYRPQPFTPDLIPEPEELEAEGPLTAQEVDELAYCEAAYTNANQADWIKWKAAHAVRSRKTYRGPEGTRTWPEYCEEVLGESESEANRSIQQWPLNRAISQQWTRPRATPASHVQALLPIAESYGQEETARSYVSLRDWASENKVRVTAADLESWVQRAQAVEQPEERPALTAETLMEAREERVKQEAKAKPRTAPKARVATVKNGGREGSHPNLGDPALGSESDADAEEEHQEPQNGNAGAEAEANEPQRDLTDPLATEASKASAVLEGIREGFVNGSLLQHARTDTLKAVMEAARDIAEAAEDVLKSR